ncbi:MAG: ABC transporter permease [Planctomycetota bacterium]
MPLNAVTHVFKYKFLVINLVLKDLKIRYKRSVLGFLWTMLNPLLMMIVLSVVFTLILRFQIENFPIFLISVLLPWNFFAQTLVQSTQSVVQSGGLIRKIYLPKSIFPLTAVTSGLVNFLFALVPLAVLMAVFRAPFTPALLILPVSIVVLYIFTLGGALFLSGLAVFFRDIDHITGVVIQMLFYLTPIIYPLTINGKHFIPEEYQIYFKFNPMVYMVHAFREPVYSGTLPSAKHFLIYVGCALASLLIGWIVFRALERRMIHHL